MKSWEPFLDLLMALIVLFLVPLLYFGQKKEALIDTIQEKETIALVDEVRSRGYLTKERYDIYLENLSLMGRLPDVSLEHTAVLYEPEYRLRTLQEVIEEQNKSYQGENTYTFHPVHTEKPRIEEPIEDGDHRNTETNESILSKAEPTPPSPNHVHSDLCYRGEKHIHTGNSDQGGGCYGKEITSKREEYCGEFNYIDHIYYVHRYQCNQCGGIFQEWTFDTSHSNGFPCRRECGGSFQYYGYETKIFYGCYNCSYVSEVFGKEHYKTITRTSYGLDCGKLEGAYYQGNDIVEPLCSQIVTSLVATHPTQRVYVGDPLITTATVTYRDGSTNIILCETSFSTNQVTEEEEVTLFFPAEWNGENETFTCTILVTVTPRNTTCINQHTYRLNFDGSDPGCPFCHAWLKSLTIHSPTTNSLSIYKGTTLQENGVLLLATYFDGHTELVEGYQDNLDTNYVGTQLVTIGYKGLKVTLNVITKRVLELCNLCGNYYELYPDNSSPGCPHCITLVPVFTGKVMEYEDKKYTETLLRELYEEEGICHFNRGDYLMVTVADRANSFVWRLFHQPQRSTTNRNVRTIYGGYIREEGGTVR